MQNTLECTGNYIQAQKRLKPQTDKETKTAGHDNNISHFYSSVSHRQGSAHHALQDQQKCIH